MSHNYSKISVEFVGYKASNHRTYFIWLKVCKQIWNLVEHMLNKIDWIANIRPVMPTSAVCLSTMERSIATFASRNKNVVRITERKMPDFTPKFPNSFDSRCSFSSNWSPSLRRIPWVSRTQLDSARWWRWLSYRCVYLREAREGSGVVESRWIHIRADQPCGYHANSE